MNVDMMDGGVFCKQMFIYYLFFMEGVSSVSDQQRKVTFRFLYNMLMCIILNLNKRGKKDRLVRE